jgi:hypothetical protein
MKTYRLAVALVAMAAAPAFAASPFDGTWKADLKASKPDDKPRIFSVKGGVYKCNCVPPIEVKADGQFHKVMGNPYIDEYRVKAGPREIVTTARKGGKDRGTATRTLSADGKSVTVASTDMTNPNGVPTKSVSTLRRVGPAPAGASAISGSWVVASQDSASAAALTETIAVKGDVVAFTTPTGISYDAPLNGTPVAIKGDPDGAMASVKMTGPRTLTEIDTIKGKPIVKTTTTVRPNGRTIDLVSEDIESGRVDRIVAHKQ